MYVCYIDESGHCGKKYNPDQPVEVLCGVVTDVSKLFKTQRELDTIFRFLRRNEIPLSELKASDAYRGRKNWSGVKPKVRDKIFELILAWAEERTCKYIVCPVDAQEFFNRKKSGCDTCATLQYPYEAGSLNILLAVERLHKSKKNNKGKTLVVFDEQNGHDLNLTRILENDLSFTDDFTGYKTKPRAKRKESRFSQIIDVPHFSKSHLSVLIQLADWAAFIATLYLNLKVYGHKEKYPGELDKITGWYERIGKNLITHTAIDAPGKSGLPAFYREIRPAGWSAKKWLV